MPDDSVLRIRVEADTGAVKDLGSSLDEVTKKVSSSSESFGSLEERVDRSQHSMMEARHAVELLGEGIGVHIPRAVAVMLSSIGPVGALLEEAFPILAAVALVEIIGKVADRIDELKDKPIKVAEAWDKVRTTFDESTDKFDTAISSMQSHLATLVNGPVAGLEVGLSHIGTKALEVKKDLDSLFAESEAAIKAGEEKWYDGIVSGIGRAYDAIKGYVAPMSLEAEKIKTHFKSIKVEIDQALTADAENKTHEALALINKDLDEEQDKYLGLNNLRKGGAASPEAVAAQQEIVNYLARAAEIAKDGAVEDAANKALKSQKLYVDQLDAAEEFHKRNIEYFKIEHSEAQLTAEQTLEIAAASKEVGAYAKAVADIEKERNKAEEGLPTIQLAIADSFKKTSEEMQKLYDTATRSSAALDEKQIHISDQVKITNIDHLASVGLITKQEEVSQKIAVYEADRKAAVSEINGELDQQKDKLSILAAATTVGGIPGLGGTEQQQKDYEKQIALVNDLRAKLDEVNAQYDAKIVQQNNTVTSSWEKLRDEIRLNTQAMQLESGALNILSQGFSGSFKTAVEQSIETGKNFGKSMEEVLGHTIASLAGFVAEWLAKKAELWILDAVLGKTAAVTTGTGEILSNAAVAASGAYAATAAIPIVGPELAPAAAATAFAGAASWLSVLGFKEGGIIPETALIMGHAKEGVLTEEQTGWLRGAAQTGVEGGASGGGTHFHGPISFNFSPTIAGQFDPKTHGAEMFDAFKSKLRMMGARV